MGDSNLPDIDSFNPFAPKVETIPKSSASPNKPAILKVSNPKEEEEQESKSRIEFKKDYSELEKKSLELDRKAKELEEREHAILTQQRINTQDQRPNTNGSDKNWPPLPAIFPCKPCFYIDFDNDFTEVTRPLAKYGHYLWISYTALLLVNLFGTLTYFIVSDTNYYSGGLFGTSILILIILPVTGFLCWNRTLYKALKKDSSLNFFGFFIMFMIQVILVIIQALGIDYLGSCGWINSLKTLSKINMGAGVFMLLIAIGFTLQAVASIFLLIKVHSYYRGTGANLQRARQEATVEIGQTMMRP